jgi:hypothetical protein
VLVFYVGYILDDKNTLCNGCIFNRMIGGYIESSCIQTMFKSKLVIDQKLLEDVHEDSLQNSKPNQPVPVQPSRRAFEGVRTPRSVLQITRKTSGHQSNTVLTLGQSLFNTSGCCPAFQNILVFRSNATRSYSEDRPDARSSHPDVDLIKIELCCF